MKTLTVCLLALLALPAAGLEPYLVKDINPVPGPADSKPSYPVTLGDAVLFFADDGLANWELWRSDGTAGGTWQLTAPPESSGLGVPFQMTERLYFFLAQGNRLWVSDGTPGGTFPLTGPEVQAPSEGIGTSSLWVPSQGVLYFVATDEDHGSELWRTDGTIAGTRLVADIWPGSKGSTISWLTEYKGQVWFGAFDGERGGALWRTDGTQAGTVLVLDPVPSATRHRAPEHLQVLGRRLTFFAPNPAGRQQLWAGDGTAKGTRPITGLSGGKGRLYDSVVRGNRLYFIADDRNGQELWISDGTGRGTRALTRFPNRHAFVGSAFLELPRQQDFDGLFLFWANDGPHGSEPWITDGTPGGTRLLRDICPGACPSFGQFWTMLDGRLYFPAQDDVNGYELWSTDGTEAGTRMVHDICPGGCGSSPRLPFIVGNRLVFLAWDGSENIWSTDGTADETVQATDFDPFLWDEGFHGAVLNGQLLFGGADPLHGLELWRTDGTAAGTQLVEDINRTDTGGSFPRGLRAFGDEVVFGADDGVPGLWRSDGTAAGTTRIRTFTLEELDGQNPYGASAEAGGLLFYFGHDFRRNYTAPWRTDGTEAGTFRLTDAGVPNCCAVQEMRAVGSTVFFDLRDQEHGRELWASDGTREGTRLVLDVLPGQDSSDPVELTLFEGKLYFSARTSLIGRELWVSDGTAAGTVRIAEIRPDSADPAAPDLPALLTVHSGRLWFFADDGEHGRELWSSDGTEAGTSLAYEFEPGSGSATALFMASLGDRLVVSLYGKGLWVTDGTPGGTRKISLWEADTSSNQEIVFQGRLYFTVSGLIWVTDGTEAGTGALLDRDGRVIYSPFEFVVLGDRLLFVAPDHLGIVVLWESDGTPEGTFPVQPVTVSGYELASAGGRAFFQAYDRETGSELWAVEPDSP
jgi:ELWxxDGT repeat protein